MDTGRFLISGKAGALEIAVDVPGIISPEKPIVVMCHPNPTMQGSMDNKVVTTTSKAFNQMGLICVRFNYRGVGKSEGAFGNYVGECEDLVAVLEWVRAQSPGVDIWLGGFSFGSYIAYKMANELGVKQLLSIAPALNYENYARASEPTMPWTIMVPDADEVVNVGDTFAWLNQVKCSYHLIKLAGVSHFFHGQLMLLRQNLVERYSTLVNV